MAQVDLKNRQQNQRQLFYETTDSGVKIEIGLPAEEANLEKNVGNGPGMIKKYDYRRRI
jgi:hypothetical protein